MSYKCWPHGPFDAAISAGNSKLGLISNISLPPCKSCGRVPCGKQCYAMKAYRNYATARYAWDSNLALAKQHPSVFWRSVDQQLTKRPQRLFRIHVAGDFPSKRYLLQSIAVAKRHPNTRFLAFTKRYKWASEVADKLPPNYQIVLSAWPQWPLYNPRCLRVAWMQDGTETRVPHDALPCPGSCENCGMCWNLSAIGRDVVFEIH